MTPDQTKQIVHEELQKVFVDIMDYANFKLTQTGNKIIARLNPGEQKGSDPLSLVK